MGLVVVKNEIWPHIGYDPHDGQELMHDSTALQRVAAWGRRAGKSTAGGRELIPEAAYTKTLLSHLEDIGKSRIFWLGGPDYTDGEKEFRVVYNDMKKLEMPFDKPGTYNDPHGGDMHISLWEGKFQIHVKSAKYEDSWDGEGLSGVELVEAAKLKEKMYEKYIVPSLADENGWLWITSTPEGKNWFYRMWQWGQDPKRPDWQSWRFPSWINRGLFPGGKNDPKIVRMRENMSTERYEQEVEASFSEFVGRVFKDFDEEIHVQDLRYDPGLPLYGATDYGWTNPMVWLAIQVDVWDNVYVLGEYRETQKDINDIASDLYQWPLARNVHTLYPEPAEPGDTEVLRKKLRIPRIAGGTGGELKWRLEKIRQWLKLKPEDQPWEKRKPKLYIDRSCKGLIWEMSDGYRYPDTRDEEQTRVRPLKEEPLDKDNHGPEALGRFFKGHFGGPMDGDNGGRAVVRRAVIRSAA